MNVENGAKQVQQHQRLCQELALTKEDKNDIEDYLKESKPYMAKKQYDDFIRLCEIFHLNPLKRDIYLIRFGNTSEIVVGYEVYRRRAASTGIPYSLEIETEWDDNCVPIKSTARLYKGGIERPFVRTLLFKEFAKHNKQGELSGIWKEKPTFMLEKCAEATILRMAYPETLSGIPYTKEEMETEEIKQNSIDVSRETISKQEAQMKVTEALYKPNPQPVALEEQMGIGTNENHRLKPSPQITNQPFVKPLYKITLASLQMKTSGNGKAYYLLTSQEGEEFQCYRVAKLEEAELKIGDILEIDYVQKGKVSFINSFSKVENIPF
ncbi:hypothetical protein AGMMS49592_0480 [Endomicrobiia bacterium]|nr:hypothetical protein AGMMS49592_0480 [Endomicrobiia bacterium]